MVLSPPRPRRNKQGPESLESAVDEEDLCVFFVLFFCSDGDSVHLSACFSHSFKK